MLAQLFVELLGLERVGIDDSFFELGGDSISSIRLVSECRKIGLIISSRNVFELQSIAAIAAIAAAPKFEDRQEDLRSGEAPLTPIMHWLLQRSGPTAEVHQSAIVDIPPHLTVDDIIASFQEILDHHDILRFRLIPSAKKFAVSAPGTVSARTLIREFDLSDIVISMKMQAVDKEIEVEQSRLRPSHGEVLRAIIFTNGLRRQLVLVAHHLIVDGVSWRILIPDLMNLWARSEGQDKRLDPIGTSFLAWAHYLDQEAKKAERINELRFWTGMLRHSEALPLIAPLDSDLDTTENASKQTHILPRAMTVILLSRLPSLLHCHVNDILLTAFGIALVRWCKRRNSVSSSRAFFDLEGHGREEFNKVVDLSRTIGWFTTITPTLLDFGNIELGATSLHRTALESALRVTQAQVREAGDHGIGYGLLRYMNEETCNELAAFPQRQVCFNYLGRFGAKSKNVRHQFELRGGSDARLALAYAIEVNSYVQDSDNGSELIATWSWAKRLASQAEISVLADDWFDILRQFTDIFPEQ
ncbi:hypothetical protein G6L45_33560 [Agrobacterium rhizogenes]|nr:hypothetical protein [Rhizobium rhizogenes]NTJ18604.1 hypothetical protein [Rhizobium rhizogenes]